MLLQNFILSLFLSPCDIFIAASLTITPSVHFITASLLAPCVDAKMHLQTAYQNSRVCLSFLQYKGGESHPFGKILQKNHILSIIVTVPST